MNAIVNYFRYIIYPAEGPRPPDAESVAAKLREEKEKLAQMRLLSKEKRAKEKAEEAASTGRKKWFGFF